MLMVNDLIGFGASVSVGDPYWNNVKLLLQPVSGDSSVIDRSSVGSSVTASGVSISATTMFTGGSSIDNGGSGSVIVNTGTAVQFGSGPFTIELMLRLLAVPTSTVNLVQQWDTASNRAIQLQFNGTSNGSLLVLAASTDGSNFSQWTTSAVTFNTGVDYYIAWVRDAGNTMTVYKDAVSVGSHADGNNYYAANAAYGIGNGNTGLSPVNAKIYSARITVGVARTITMPTALWPTS